MDAGIAIYNPGQYELLARLKNFSIVEISGEMLEEAEQFGLFPALPGTVLVRELLPRRIMDDLPDAPPTVCRELLKLFEARCDFMEKYSIPYATLAVPLGRMSTDAQYNERMLSLIRCMYGIALRRNVGFRCELRVPENFENSILLTQKFCRCCNISTRMLIDFHPHEPKGFELLDEAVQYLPFNRDAWRISFEVASCNYLSADVVKRVLNLSRPGSCESDYVIFSPGSGADDENYRQLDLLSGECFNNGR